MLQQVIDYLLFGVLVQSSNIEGDEFELIPFGSHFREISVDLLSSTIGECVLPVFSVTRLISVAVSIFLW